MLNIDTFIERLHAIMDYYKLSHSNFANKIGVPRSSISHIMSGRNKPSLDFMLKIVESFKDVELNWLVYGIGKFPKESTITKEKPNLFREEEFEKKSTTKEKIIPQPEKIIKENTIKKKCKFAERVIIFYTDGSFKIYEYNDDNTKI